jgi:hypothetical protein
MTQFIATNEELDILREEIYESLQEALLKPLNSLTFIVICSNANGIVRNSMCMFGFVSQAKKYKESIINNDCDSKYELIEISLITEFGDLIPLMENDICELMKREKEM